MKQSRRNERNAIAKAEKGYAPSKYALKMQAERRALSEAAKAKSQGTEQ